MTARAFLDRLFRTAIAAAHPSTCLPPHLPPPPRFGRLIVLNPKRPLIKWVAVVSGLVVNPAFYLAYARSLLGRRDATQPA